MKLYRIYKEILAEDFKTQAAKYLKQGIDREIVKTYLEKFKFIKDNKFNEMFDDINIQVPKEKRQDIDSYKDFHDLEVLVDYVSGRRKGVSNLTKQESIEVEGKPIFEDDDFIVYYADTPRACVKYKGKVPYSWCVARSNASNMFFTYRFKPYEPAFYFIRDKKLSEKEFSEENMMDNISSGSFKYPYHFFVIQVPKNLIKDSSDQPQYIVTSALNDGDKQMSWNDILKINKNLDKIKDVLEPKPFTKDERDKFTRFKNGVTDNEFKKLSYEDKRNYLDIYPTIAKPITTKQFKELPDDLINLYVSFGIGLNEQQFSLIKDNNQLMKRYIQISRRKLSTFLESTNYNRLSLRLMYTELIVLSEDEISKYMGVLDDTEIARFIRDNGKAKLDFLEKYVKKTYTDEYRKVKEIFKNGTFDELDDMVPKLVDVYVRDNFIEFDFGNYGNRLENALDYQLSELLEVLKYTSSPYEPCYDPTFVFDDEDYFIDTLKRFINNLKNSDSIADRFKKLNLTFDEDTVIDILTSYNKIDDIKSEMENEFCKSDNEGADIYWDIQKKEYDEVIRYNNDYGTISFDINMFLIGLAKFSRGRELFVKNIDDFIKNIESFTQEEILRDNGLDDSYDGLHDSIMNGYFGYATPVNDESIMDTIESSLKDALDDYEDDDDENTFKLKSQIINNLKEKLKAIGEDPDAKQIENEIVRIIIDRSRFRMDGSVYMTLIDKKNSKKHEGYVFINDLPTYFKNYKLFEQLTLLRKLLKR